MNTAKNYMTHSLRNAGFSLLEVMISIVVFAICLLALASLQGKLTRYGTVALRNRCQAAHPGGKPCRGTA
jgi:prepilin-type N-terminal cleavage/methylation domain-containing protein